MKENDEEKRKLAKQQLAFFGGIRISMVIIWDASDAIEARRRETNDIGCGGKAVIGGYGAGTGT